MWTWALIISMSRCFPACCRSRWSISDHCPCASMAWRSHLASLSSLCVIEHIGLGRYGDPLDSEGHLRAIAELKRVIAPGGDLYISLPVREGNRLYFNAHRALDETQLLPLFAPFQVVDRAYVCDKTFGRERTTSEAVGCYHLRRPA
jgi:hypothetical protein